MKDIVITKIRIKREFFIFLYCFMLALALNTFSIVYYKTRFIELFTTIHVTTTIAMLLYVISGMAKLFSSRYK